MSAFRRKESNAKTKTVNFGWTIFALAAASILIGGCAASSDHGDVREAGDLAAVSPEQCAAGAAIHSAALSSNDDQSYRIQPGDELAIDFYLNPEFNDQVMVDPDGNINLRLVGAIQAAGNTPVVLAQAIDHRYLSELRSPDAVVHVKNMPARQIYVQGQVTRPGSFPLQTGMTALQAIADAGGMTPDADDDSVVLIRRDACGHAAGQRLDIASAVDHPGSGEDAALMPHDVIVVPRTRISNIDLFVQHYIRGLLPVEPYMPLPIP